jgi:hypothetical protein
VFFFFECRVLEGDIRSAVFFFDGLFERHWGVFDVSFYADTQCGGYMCGGCFESSDVTLKRWRRIWKKKIAFVSHPPPILALSRIIIKEGTLFFLTTTTRAKHREIILAHTPPPEFPVRSGQPCRPENTEKRDTKRGSGDCVELQSPGFLVHFTTSPLTGYLD